MNVVAVEYGDRPAVMTRARRFAPEGVKLLAETLGHMQFAEDGIIILDWSNETRLQPDEVAKPVVLIRTTKLVPELGPDKRLTVEVRLDVEDTFGRDTIMAEDFIAIIMQMEDKMLSTIAQAKEF